MIIDLQEPTRENPQGWTDDESEDTVDDGTDNFDSVADMREHTPPPHNPNLTMPIIRFRPTPTGPPNLAQPEGELQKWADEHSGDMAVAQYLVPPSATMPTAPTSQATVSGSQSTKEAKSYAVVIGESPAKSPIVGQPTTSTVDAPAEQLDGRRPNETLAERIVRMNLDSENSAQPTVNTDNDAELDDEMLGENAHHQEMDDEELDAEIRGSQDGRPTDAGPPPELS